MKSYQAIEIYRFRFARVCVPLSGPAFLLASPFEDTPEACGVFPCGLGDSEFIFLCRFCLVQRRRMGCTALLRVRNGEFALQIRSGFGVRGRKISTPGLCLPCRHFSSLPSTKVCQLIFTSPTIILSFLVPSS